MEQREGDQQDVKYLVLATFLMLFALCNPILLLCAIPACIGALIVSPTINTNHRVSPFN